MSSPAKSIEPTKIGHLFSMTLLNEKPTFPTFFSRGVTSTHEPSCKKMSEFLLPFGGALLLTGLSSSAPDASSKKICM